jgi:hypothetical protein
MGNQQRQEKEKKNSEIRKAPQCGQALHTDNFFFCTPYDRKTAGILATLRDIH